MRELFRCMKAELIKMRHTFLYPVHSVLPVLGSGIFLLYYGAAGGSDAAQISGYMEAVGIALPFVISMICAENVELESKNHFQVFLRGAGCRFNALLAKYLVLAGIGFMAVLSAVMLFAIGYQWGLAKAGILFHDYGKLAVILCLGSAPLYLEHLFLNLMFSKPVSLCAGIVEFLLSALFLTGLGDGRWYFFPCTWSARGAAAYLAVLFV